MCGAFAPQQNYIMEKQTHVPVLRQPKMDTVKKSLAKDILRKALSLLTSIN